MDQETHERRPLIVKGDVLYNDAMRDKKAIKVHMVSHKVYYLLFNIAMIISAAIRLSIGNSKTQGDNPGPGNTTTSTDLIQNVENAENTKYADIAMIIAHGASIITIFFSLMDYFNECFPTMVCELLQAVFHSALGIASFLYMISQSSDIPQPISNSTMQDIERAVYNPEIITAVTTVAATTIYFGAADVTAAVKRLGC